MIGFMVLSMPRSGSAWAANWLSNGASLCLHDPVLERDLGALDQWAADSRPLVLGIADTAFALDADRINQHPAPKVILHRPLEDVQASLERLGLTRLGRAWRGALWRITGLHLPHSSLWDPVFADDIHERLLGRKMTLAERTRHKLLCGLRVEADLARVPVRPAAVAAFRARIEGALAQ